MAYKDILSNNGLKVQIHTSFVMSVIVILNSLLLHSPGKVHCFVTTAAGVLSRLVNMKPPLPPLTMSHLDAATQIVASAK